MKFDFNDCYWHDSLLKNIFIDRSNPGHKDTVELTVEWYEDDSESKIIFSNVYLFKAIMNFGIIAKESILGAWIAPEDDPDFLDIHRKWKGDVKLNCYIIETNSTGGLIKIFAEDVEMFPNF